MSVLTVSGCGSRNLASSGTCSHRLPVKDGLGGRALDERQQGMLRAANSSISLPARSAVKP